MIWYRSKSEGCENKTGDRKAVSGKGEELR